jgi:glucokinase
MQPSGNSGPITVLAVDVGGTNTSCAIVSAGGSTIEKRFERRYATKSEPSLPAPLSRFIEEAKASRAPEPQVLCVSGAGPVNGRSITLTNATWGIDGAELEQRFGLPTLVINDFSAIAWGILLLDRNNPEELVQLPAPDGTLAAPSEDGPIVVIGAGTGLGFGYILRDGGVRVYPSEGGHVSLPVFDEESREFSRWLESRYGFAAGAEAGVSGQGIGHIFMFMAGKDPEPTAAVRSILGEVEHERPAMIAEAAAAGDPLCVRAMRMFVRLYARVASDASAVFMPTGGIYLAGGVAAKNLRYFTEASCFMESFGKAYRDHIKSIAARTPVFVVKDYAISIYGAANAAIHYLGQARP